MDIYDVSRWFLGEESMTNKKLQKLCYYSIAWGHALMGKAIVDDSRFEAWVHGPASPTLYREYKKYGWNDIPKAATKPEFKNDITELLEAVWITYGDKSGNELEALSHSELPWIEARNGLASDEYSTKRISSKTMASYYNSIKTAE